MKNIKILISICIIMTLFISCVIPAPAKGPEFIDPMRISPVKYTFYNCDQIKQEYNYLIKELCRLTGVQNKIASTDNILLLVSLIIPVPLPLTGGHSSIELALVKGNIEAIENVIVDMDCGQIKKTIFKNKEVRINNERLMKEEKRREREWNEQQ